MNDLVVVSGPTASGKSALAIAIAKRYDGEVVSCDAMQVYRGFDIGTAKLPPEERAVPHRMIDICDPRETFSAGEFAARGREALREIADRGRLPVVAGGTGFYLRALLEGLFEGPAGAPHLRERLRAMEARGAGRVHRLLQRVDPEAAAHIHPNDVNKSIRAAEVFLSTGAPITTLHGAAPEPLTGYRILHFFLDPDRTLLYERINRRCEEMFRGGLIEETGRLLAEDVPRSAQAFLGVGYREALAVLDGAMTAADAIAQTQQATRRYAKRQWTWFRRQTDAIRLSGFGDDPEIEKAAVESIGQRLKNSGER